MDAHHETRAVHSGLTQRRFAIARYVMGYRAAFAASARPLGRRPCPARSYAQRFGRRSTRGDTTAPAAYGKHPSDSESKNQSIFGKMHTLRKNSSGTVGAGMGGKRKRW